MSSMGYDLTAYLGSHYSPLTAITAAADIAMNTVTPRIVSLFEVYNFTIFCENLLATQRHHNGVFTTCGDKSQRRYSSTIVYTTANNIIS